MLALQLLVEAVQLAHLALQAVQLHLALGVDGPAEVNQNTAAAVAAAAVAAAAAAAAGAALVA